MNILQLLNMMPGAVGQGLIWGIMAIGVYITYRILDIADLTVDGTIATGGCVAVILITRFGWNPWAAMLIAFGAGMLAGLVTGVLHTVMGIPAILAGILTQLAQYSIDLRIMTDPVTLHSRANVSINLRKFPVALSSSKVLTAALDNPIWLMLLVTVAVIALMYWFFGTEYGCALRAVGANGQMARAQGINTSLGKVVGLMLSNGLVAFSGALLSQYQGFADVQMGRGAIVIGLAAVIIGEVIFGRLFRNFGLKLLAVSLGAIIYYMVIQIVLWLGLTTDDLKMLTALVVAVFLSVPNIKNRLLRGKGAKARA